MSRGVLFLLLLTACAGELSALETVRGVLRNGTEFECSPGCGTYYVEPDPGYLPTMLEGNFRLYLDMHVEVTGIRDNCSGCFVLLPLVEVVVLPPLTAVSEAPGTVPSATRLAQNYPNPFNPSTIIEYELAASSSVRLSVLNLAGETVGRLVDEEEPPGVYRQRWLAGDRPAGVYFYELRVAGGGRNSSITRKMLLLR